MINFVIRLTQRYKKMKYRESQPLATSPKATDPTKKPKKTRKVKFGNTTVTTTKSREDGYVKKTTQVINNND